MAMVIMAVAGALAHPHRETRHGVDLLAVHPQVALGHGHDRAFFALRLEDAHLALHQAVLRHHLAAVLPGHRFAAGHRLEAGGTEPFCESPVYHGHLQQAHEGLDAQGARLHGVPVEVGLEEPVVGAHGHLTAVPLPVHATGAVEQAEAAGRATETGGAVGDGHFGRRGGEPRALVGGAPHADLVHEGGRREEAEGGLHVQHIAVRIVGTHGECHQDHARRS
jgi:hypothetical protein